jgi:hypothetical protein
VVAAGVVGAKTEVVVGGTMDFSTTVSVVPGAGLLMELDKKAGAGWYALVDMGDRVARTSLRGADLAATMAGEL